MYKNNKASSEKWLTVSALSKKLCCGVVVCLFIIGASTGFAAGLGKTEQLKVIELKGAELSSWLGDSIDSYSVGAVVNNRIVPIPFQFDEYNVNGEVYFPEAKAEIDGEPGLVDPEDRIVFMFTDAGPRKSKRMRADGKIVAEVKLTSFTGNDYYVYIVKGGRLQSEDVYVRYAAALGRVETDEYTLVMSKDNALNWESFTSRKYTGEQESPLDTMKLRLRTGISSPYPKWTFNNKHFIARPYVEKVGAVRAITQMEVTFYILKIPILKFDMQVIHAASSVTYTARVHLKWWQRITLWKPKLSISLDGNDLKGLVTKSSSNRGLISVVDGRMSEDEKVLRGSRYAEGDKWIWARSGQNFDLLSSFRFIGRELPLTFYLEDDADKKDRPERFQGQSPNTGFQIEEIPLTGFFGLTVDLFFSDDFGDGPGDGIHAGLTLRPRIKVTEM